MAHVWVPSLLRDLTGGQATVEVGGRSVGALLDALDAQYPGMKARLIENGAIIPGMQVLVDGKAAQMGLRQPVGEGSEVHFVPALAGG
jgi:molybdopterin synthase sulfur carrier subunit